MDIRKLIFCLLIPVQALCYKSTVAPLPAVVEVQSSISSVSQAVERLYVSGNFKVPAALQTRVFSNADLAAVEVQAITSLIHDRTVKNSEKSIHLIRYGLGDKRMTNVLIEARRAGIPVIVTTDLNPSYKGSFQDPNQKFNIDVARATPIGEGSKMNPAAAAVEALKGAGFEFWKDLFTQPLYSEKMDRTPIMHEKALLLRSGIRKITYFGTANLAPNPRYNRLYKIVDPLFYDHYLEHITALNEAFSSGLEIDAIKLQLRKKIQYKDGSLEIAFTDGKFNPNDRIVEEMKVPFQELVLSHFVNTFRPGVEALRESLTNNPKARVFNVADDRFASLNEWGLTVALDGFDVWAPFGKPTHGFAAALTNQIETYVYQRPARDPETGFLRIETSEEGPPTGRHLWHDKTSVFLREKQAVLFTGSLNLSNNFHNSELQVRIEAPVTSWIVNGTVASVKGTVATENMKWAVPMHLATLRNALGLATRHTDLEIPIDLAERFYRGLLLRDMKAIELELNRLAGIKSKLSPRLSVEQMQDRVNRFTDFLAWYYRVIPMSDQNVEARIRRAAAVSMILGMPNLPDFKKVQILKSAVWQPRLSDEQIYALVQKGLEVLGASGVDPKYLTPMGVASLPEVANTSSAENPPAESP